MEAPRSAAEAVEAPAEMAGGGVAETVEDIGEADQEGGKPVAAQATENRRKMRREDGNGHEMEAGRRARGEGGAKEVGGGEQRRAKPRLGYSERVMVPFELRGVHRRPKAGGRRRATSGVVEAEAASGCGVECRESSRQALGSLWLGGGICTRRKRERRRRAVGGGGRKEAAVVPLMDH
ncbi:hypothetical protein B0H14DRAFT_2580197 [Mycena olivaceomarginata]|nr:hypothetical protein B0H14DRAFT_2580197 [Mycena olivaceomarginata]